MKVKYFYLSVLTLVVVIILFACRHEILPRNNGNNSIPPATAGCNPDSVYFVNEILPLISSNCAKSGCHDNITHAEGVNLTTYNNIIRYVVPGNAGNSKLYKMLNKANGDRMPPAPMAALSQAQKDKISKWINQGAKNNNCFANCDTTVFTFSGAVKTIMDNKCVGCHNPLSLGGSVDLSIYAGIKTIALNGKLFGSVSQQPGYQAMPKNGVKLSDCELTQIKKWIDAGSLNN